MSDQQNAMLIDDDDDDHKLACLLLWYVECQNAKGRCATEEELKAFGNWYDRSVLDQALIKLMLLKYVCIKMDGNEPQVWLSESGKLHAEYTQRERATKR